MIRRRNGPYGYNLHDNAHRGSRHDRRLRSREAHERPGHHDAQDRRERDHRREERALVPDKDFRRPHRLGLGRVHQGARQVREKRLPQGGRSHLCGLCKARDGIENGTRSGGSGSDRRRATRAEDAEARGSRGSEVPAGDARRDSPYLMGPRRHLPPDRGVTWSQDGHRNLHDMRGRRVAWGAGETRSAPTAPHARPRPSKP
jgi:hypothetical protein